MQSANHQIDVFPDVVVNPAGAVVINKDNIETSIRFIANDGKIKVISKVFPRLTAITKEIKKWLNNNMVKDVAVQGGGCSWKMIWNSFEDSFNLHLTHFNDQVSMPETPHQKKSESEKISELLQYGLLKIKFIPDRLTRELRDLTRMREGLIERKSVLGCRIQSILEEVGITPASLRSYNNRPIYRKAGWHSVVENLIEICDSSPVSEHSKYILDILASDYKKADKSIMRLSARIALMSGRYEKQISGLMQIPGLSRRYAERILAETGTDYDRFDSHKALLAWGGMFPPPAHGDGERTMGKNGKEWFKRAIADSAIAAANAANSTLARKYTMLESEYGIRKAMSVIKQDVVYLIYNIIREGKSYSELRDFIEFSEDTHTLSKPYKIWDASIP